MQVETKLIDIFHILNRVAPDADLAGNPANNFAGYRIFG